MSLVEDYFQLQKKYESKYGTNTIVLLEKGSFYEVYGIDNDLEQSGQASNVSQVLNIQLTKANKKIEANNVHNPLMTGFPTISFKKNLKVLLEAGYTVVTYDQQELPTIRKVTNIYSAGTYIDEQINNSSNYICCIFLEYNINYSVGISFIELSTGTSNLYEYNLNDKTLLFENINRIVESYNPKEFLIVPCGIELFEIKHEINTKNKLIHSVQEIESEFRNINYQNDFLQKIYKLDTILTPLEEFNLERYKYASLSLVYLFQFCFEHNENVLNYVQDPILNTDEGKLILHNNAIYQLNIESYYNQSKNSISSLFDVVNNTSTPMGKRLLKSVLLNPITDIDELTRQYKDIENMKNSIDWYENQLKSIIDIERYHRKMSLKKLQPYEFVNLQSSYESINTILSQKHSSENYTSTFKIFFDKYLSMFNLSQMKSFTISDISENIFNEGTFTDIDDIQNNISNYKNKLENECKKLSNLINNKENIIKLEQSSKQGYYIYSTNNRCEQLQKIVKDEYSFKKESKTKCYITSDKINTWIDKLIKYQNKLKPIVTEKYVNLLIEFYEEFSEMFIYVSNLIAKIDVIKSKTKTAEKYNYCQPCIINSESSYINAKSMRHPIIECLDTDYDYVPNDVQLDNDNCGILLYGVNGSGKSCYSKAVGLCIVLAQSGHYVPCTEFFYSPFSKLYTRISGDDNIFKGQSSFFVEMGELKSIINYSDKKSIVIGDEVCKGTEDVSAVAIVGTTINHLLQNNTKFIFATHLHKLPSISILKNVKSLNIKHIAVEFTDTTIFTRKLKNGSGDLLYGLEIAHHILKNESFHNQAFKLRNELLNKSTRLMADKKSKYNSNLYVDHCQICNSTDKLEAHHIVFQSKNSTQKHRKSNLVVLCNQHHEEVHSKKLIIYGWKKTTEGKMLDYIYCSQ